MEEKIISFRGTACREQEPQDTKLYLVPLTQNGQAYRRSLPLELGRVELVRWWLTSCCINRSTTQGETQPHLDRSSCCEKCHLVVKNAKYLSKSMLRLENTSKKLIVLGKNSRCLYMNGKSVDNIPNEKAKASKVDMPFSNGDTVSFQSDDDSRPWMEFRICSGSTFMVTPEGKNLRKSYDNSSSLRSDRCHSRTKESQFFLQQDESLMLRDTSVIKRKRASLSKGSETDESNKSKRKLFSTPEKKCDNKSASGYHNEYSSEMELDAFYDTQKGSSKVLRSSPSKEEQSQPTYNHNRESSPVGDSSMLSLPQFGSEDEAIDDDDGESDQIKGGSIRSDGKDSAHLQSIQQQLPSSSGYLDCSSISRSMSDDTSEWKPVSDLTRSEWQELQEPAARTPTVRQALAGLILEQNRGERIDWLPALLNGSIIQKNNLLPKESRR